MSDLTLTDFSFGTAGAQEPLHLWDLVLRFYGERGIPRVSYHHFGADDQTGAHGIRAYGFPEDWVAYYLEQHLFDHDPIVALTARTSQPFFWRDIRALVELTGAEDEMIRALETADLGDGLSFQVNGPQMRNGYVGLGFARRRPRLTEPQIFELRCAAQIAHLRVCDLVPPSGGQVRDLTPREREIMLWIARGKSNGVIADILHISRHTVDTLVRRIFEKLDVSDRTTAAIKAVGAGIVLA